MAPFQVLNSPPMASGYHFGKHNSGHGVQLKDDMSTPKGKLAPQWPRPLSQATPKMKGRCTQYTGVQGVLVKA